jgi:hypothetical protein
MTDLTKEDEDGQATHDGERQIRCQQGRKVHDENVCPDRRRSLTQAALRAVLYTTQNKKKEKRVWIYWDS